VDSPGSGRDWQWAPVNMMVKLRVLAPHRLLDRIAHAPQNQFSASEVIPFLCHKETSSVTHLSSYLTSIVDG
jgi:hypothetical protein